MGAMSARPASTTSRSASGGSGPRWLDEHEQRVWRDFLAASRLLFERLDQELQRDAGMPHAYYEVLVGLSEAPGHRLRMSELAQRALSSRSRLSHAVARLEEAGWVRRESCATDRRGQFAVLTPAGLSAIEAAAPGHVEGVRTHLFDALDRDEVRRFGEIVAKLAEHLREGGDCGVDHGECGLAEPC
jgi:DNA-binding MarR family transcriptional regulator